ncbi:MAG TPA: hydroxymethylbilane synthase [Candidatus Binatia bacterium]|nr:hydroxymethylbilane synthase [Candidatus Binatia bacterium]
MSRPIRIGTRGSALALTQSRWTQQQLAVRGQAAELVTITTSGDRFVDRPLSAVGGKGLFVKEIEEALSDGRIDCAVHSMKDVPGELAPGLTIAAVPSREDARDVVLTRTGVALAALPPESRVGTTSLRRVALVRAANPALAIAPLRGNVDTRLRKLDAGEFDAIVLAAAGLNRLGIIRDHVEHLDPVQFVPAIGQGALAIETRADDIPAAVAALDDPAARTAVDAERAFLIRVGGSCHTPLAAHATLTGDRLHLRAVIASPDGRQVIRGERTGAAADAATIGTHLADELLTRGGDVILQALASS